MYMLTVFRIILLLVIVLSLFYTFDKKLKNTQTNAAILCVTGIAAYIVTYLV